MQDSRSPYSFSGVNSIGSPAIVGLVREVAISAPSRREAIYVSRQFYPPMSRHIIIVGGPFIEDFRTSWIEHDAELLEPLKTFAR
jgi:hypothetical protein